MKTSLTKILSPVCLIVLFTALCASTAQAAAFTATQNGNWSLGATWGNTGNNVVGSGVPGSGDAATIPVGISVTYDNSAPASASSVDVSGSITITKSGGTFGDFAIQSGGTFSFGGQVPVTFSGNFTNFGNMNISGQSQTAHTIYTGTDKFLVGNVTNQITDITGTYDNLGFLVTAVNAQNGGLVGTGSLTNHGTMVQKGNSAYTITTLDCSPVGNTFIHAGINFSGTPTVKAATYYHLLLGNTGSSGWALTNSTVLGDLTITNSGNISTFPSGGVVGGVFSYFTTSGTSVTIPLNFTVGSFHQASTGILTIPANGTMLVTNTGAGVWNRTGGQLRQSASSTVRFTGEAPEITGTVVNGFANLLIDSTATNASATSAFVVTNTLTLASGAGLDVTALGTYTLANTQTVASAGTLKGTIASGTRSKFFPGTDLTYGTAHITGDATLGGTNALIMDVNSTAAGANDHLIASGTVTFSGATLKLKAPSPGAVIDTANDYTLVTAGSVSGTPTLEWDVAPNDVGSYSLVVDATTVKLHFGGIVVPPAGQPTLTNSVSGGQLTLTWDITTFPGYLVQGQTNSGITTSWTDTSAFDASPTVIDIDKANASTFFRLFKP